MKGELRSYALHRRKWTVNVWRTEVRAKRKSITRLGNAVMKSKSSRAGKQPVRLAERNCKAGKKKEREGGKQRKEMNERPLDAWEMHERRNDSKSR